jgi:hypothetical protein
VRQLRTLDLRKAPSISETIDWARTLAVLGATELTSELLAATANVAIKYDRDLLRTLEVLPRLVDPNAVVPEPGHPHSHDHGDGHSHSHDDHPAADPADPAGRHDQDYYGSPGQLPRPAPVGRSQAERSFNARGARRRPV